MPGKSGKIVVYVTSMHAVRETFEQCQFVLQTLRNHQVVFTSKDIYLHPDYSEELRLRLGDPDNITVPQVIVKLGSLNTFRHGWKLAGMVFQYR